MTTYKGLDVSDKLQGSDTSSEAPALWVPPTSKPEPYQLATYREQPIRSHRGNPLIEALPYSQDTTGAMKLLQIRPLHDESERKWPTHLREKMILDTLSDLFVPLNVHADIYQRFARIIPEGYKRRNPASPSYFRENTLAAQTLKKNLDDSDSRTAKSARNTNSDGFGLGRIDHPLATPGVTPQCQVWTPGLSMYMVGLPGVGKSRTEYEVCSLFPQVIEHTNYKGQEWSFRQVVWAILQCSPDGSTRELCLDFFRLMDRLLGTNHYHNYGHDGKEGIHKSTLRPNMAHVAGMHGLGLLIIDEIQRLDQAASGGKAEMLNFFAQLVDTMGVPVVLVGTFKALPILSGEFHQARRAGGQGDKVWDRFSEDSDDWNLLVEALWTYQFTDPKTTLTDALRKALYKESTGITDIAIKVYMLAQILAMNTRSPGHEHITATLIEDAAKLFLRMARPIVQAIGRNDKAAMSKYEDVRPKHMEWILDSLGDAIELVHQQKTTVSDKSQGASGNAESADASPGPEGAATSPASGSAEPVKADAAQFSQTGQVGDAVKAPRKSKAKSSKEKDVPEGGLLAAVRDGKKDKKSFYDSLDEAGLRKPATEFL